MSFYRKPSRGRNWTGDFSYFKSIYVAHSLSSVRKSVSFNIGKRKTTFADVHAPSKPFVYPMYVWGWRGRLIQDAEDDNKWLWAAAAWCSIAMKMMSRIVWKPAQFVSEIVETGQLYTAPFQSFEKRKTSIVKIKENSFICIYALTLCFVFQRFNVDIRCFMHDFFYKFEILFNYQ